MVYFNMYHFIALARTAEIVSELYQQQVSEGTVAAAVVEVAGQVEAVVGQVKTFLAETNAQHGLCNAHLVRTGLSHRALRTALG